MRVFIFEEFVRDPASGCREIFEFLGVDPDFLPDLARRNTSHTYWSRLLYNLISWRPGWLHTAYTKSPMQLRLLGYKATKPLYWLNMRPTDRQPMDSGLGAELEDRYRDDVGKLGEAAWQGSGPLVRGTLASCKQLNGSGPIDLSHGPSIGHLGAR